jgi:hypothetical protein
MNDPREFKNLSLPTMTTNGKTLTRKQLKATERCVNLLRGKVRLGAFTRDDDAQGKGGLRLTDARGYARPMMWAHYAKNHRGVCLVFDRTPLETALRARFGPDVMTGAITYDTLNPNSWTPILDTERVHALGEQAAAEEFFTQYKSPLMFTKNRDWSVEREWRFAIDGQPSGFATLQLSSGIVAGLVVGMSVGPTTLAKLGSVVSTFGIRDHVAVADLHNVNVIDILPVKTSGPTLRRFTNTELRANGYFRF